VNLTGTGFLQSSLSEAFSPFSGSSFSFRSQDEDSSDYGQDADQSDFHLPERARLERKDPQQDASTSPDTPPVEKVNPGLQEELPIAAYRQEILQKVEENPVTIIVAETGAGKSTQVPQYLLEAGYNVTVTQPRRLAASSVADWVARQQGTTLGGTVGFRHSLENSVSKDTRLVFATDGYQLIRELHNPMTPEEAANTVLVLDEVHEFNSNMEALLALMKKRMADGIAPKLVIMSATMDSSKLSEYFGGAPVVDVPGRTFDVETLPCGGSIADDVAHAVARGENTLVFLPGKGEIRMMEAQLKAMGVDAEIVPLHSQLARQEQEKAFGKYDRPKVILSTDIAQTSLTIDDIDLVISSGLRRTIEVSDGVETLAIRPFSQDDYMQQKGRAGRVKPGKFIYHGLRAFNDLQREAPAEIQNTRLESLTLRLISGHEDIRRLQFLHPVTDESTHQAYSALHQLNLAGPTGHITSQGLEVAKLPVNVHTGKMLVRARQLSQEKEDPEILASAVDVAAIMEAEGITLPKTKKKWTRLIEDEHESDPLAQLQVLHKALEMDPGRYGAFGIDSVGLRRAREMQSLLRRRMDVEEEFEYSEVPGPELKEALLDSIWTGMIDTIFQRAGESDRGNPMYKPLGGKGLRQLGKDSVIDPNGFIVGRPFDIAVLDERHDDQRVVPLIFMASNVSRDWLRKNRPVSKRKQVHQALKEETKREQGKKKNSPRIGGRRPRWFGGGGR
jgi:HrpA-like RNA helicase